MSNSEFLIVVFEAADVRDFLSFLFCLDIWKMFLLLQQKPSKHMYSNCLDFPCFIRTMAACMHTFCKIICKYNTSVFPHIAHQTFLQNLRRGAGKQRLRFVALKTMIPLHYAYYQCFFQETEKAHQRLSPFPIALASFGIFALPNKEGKKSCFFTTEQ